jgi:hypothetical protein
MGHLKQNVLIDRFTGSEVWNQPLAGYRFKYPTPADYLGCSSGGVCKINLSSTIWWYNDSGVSAHVVTPPFEFEDISNSDGNVVEHRDLELELWLDGPIEFNAEGKITKSGNVISTRDGIFFVGGSWKNGADASNDGHPDYMWIPYSLSKPDASAPDPYGNPYLDLEWMKAHLLVPGGKDDPSLRPITIPTAAPPSSPTPSPTSTTQPRPTSVPIPFPTIPIPTHAPIPIPMPIPIPIPTQPAPPPRP